MPHRQPSLIKREKCITLKGLHWNVYTERLAMRTVKGLHYLPFNLCGVLTYVSSKNEVGRPILFPPMEFSTADITFSRIYSSLYRPFFHLSCHDLKLSLHLARRKATLFYANPRATKQVTTLCHQFALNGGLQESTLCLLGDHLWFGWTSITVYNCNMVQRHLCIYD